MTRHDIGRATSARGRNFCSRKQTQLLFYARLLPAANGCRGIAAKQLGSGALKMHRHAGNICRESNAFSAKSLLAFGARRWQALPLRRCESFAAKRNGWQQQLAWREIAASRGNCMHRCGSALAPALLRRSEQRRAYGKAISAKMRKARNGEIGKKWRKQQMAASAKSGHHRRRKTNGIRQQLA